MRTEPVTSTHRAGAVAPAAAPPGGRRRGVALRPQGYTWVLPALVVSAGLIYYSIGYTGYISTLDWDGSNPVRTSVGFDNYLHLLRDPIVWSAIGHTAVFFVVTLAGQVALGMLFAGILHSRVWIGSVYKVALFLPVVLAPAIMAPVFRQIYAADGEVNGVLRALGLDGLAQSWLAQASTALPVVMLITLWHTTGLSFILYFAAFGQIDPEILEAARIDGAGNVRAFWYVVVPSARGTTVALTILGAIGALKTFDVPYLVTAAGPNHATEFLGTYIYRQAIPLAHVGYGAALSVVLLILAIAMALILNLRRRRGPEA